jgi:hypothetical protein
MNANLLRRISKWLVNVAAWTDGCTGIELEHVPGKGYRDELLREWSLEVDETLMSDAPRFSAEIVDIAEREARGRDGGVRRYNFALRAQSVLGKRALLTFLVDGRRGAGPGLRI